MPVYEVKTCEAKCEGCGVSVRFEVFGERADPAEGLKRLRGWSAVSFHGRAEVCHCPTCSFRLASERCPSCEGRCKRGRHEGGLVYSDPCPDCGGKGFGAGVDSPVLVSGGPPSTRADHMDRGLREWSERMWRASEGDS